ncbi:hypothetical protein AB1L42_13305 [Thalassoglobus sp. JC818]|uniref:hypothetical protein n=1 Tax=Thalassoglobus sp. JC818 TaxID=3232136 RepID=UPI0034589AB3
MNVAVVQPIAGVSVNRETDIEAVYPSIASGFLGQLIGMIMGAVSAAIPVTFIRVIVLVAVGAALLPLGLLAYALNKIFGVCYIVTNRSVQKRSFLGNSMTAQVALTDIDHIEIASGAGYKFHRVGDLNLVGAQGNLLLTIEAIQFPERLKHVILDARQARQLSDRSLAQIQSR